MFKHLKPEGEQRMDVEEGMRSAEGKSPWSEGTCQGAAGWKPEGEPGPGKHTHQPRRTQSQKLGPHCLISIYAVFSGHPGGRSPEEKDVLASSPQEDRKRLLDPQP